MVQVRDIMTKNVITLSPDDTLTSFFSLMQKHHIHDIFVVKSKDNISHRSGRAKSDISHGGGRAKSDISHGGGRAKRELVGIVRYQDIVRKGIIDPSKEKIKTIMSLKPPIISPDMSIEEAAELIFKSGMKAMPVVEHGNILGVVSMTDIARHIANIKAFRQTRLEQIVTQPEVLDIDADIGTIRVKMREKNISHIPIVNKNGTLEGMVTSFDLLKALKPRESMGWWSMAAEMDRITSLPASTIMNKHPVTMGREATLFDAINEMTSKNVSYVILVENGIPIGIATIKDFVEFYVSQLSRPGVYVQITGLGEEDEFVQATVDRQMKDFVSKINPVFNVQFMAVHIKRHGMIQHIPKRIKYSVRIRLMTDKGMFSVSSVRWDIRDAIREALSQLERKILSFKETIVKRQKKNRLKAKRGFD